MGRPELDRPGHPGVDQRARAAQALTSALPLWLGDQRHTNLAVLSVPLTVLTRYPCLLIEQAITVKAMSAQKPLQLHQYAYDPLDRHVKTGTEDQATHLFYCRQRVATEITGDTRAQVFESQEAVLAYRTHQGEGLTTALVAGDTKRSTLSVLNHSQPASVAFTPYGHQPFTPGAHRVPGFNGERADPLTGHYLLGNGYRAFNPILMRFNSPDRWSPFGKGGFNAYAYCAGEPVNRTDPTGHAWHLSSESDVFWA